MFDIETIPDLEGGRKILGLEGVDDDGVAQAMASRRLQDKGNDFQPSHLHRVVAVSVALRQGDGFRVWSLGEPESSEAELVRRFFEGIEKYRPTLVSWNGSGFDLPVLHYRALKYGIAAPRYWDTGHFDREAKWDNYLGRYQFRHTDLMDVLALYNGRNYAPLDEIAQLTGLPGKLGMEGSQVFGAWRAGRLAEIRAYCETDVLNTYLIYLRFRLMRGQLDSAGYTAELERVRAFLKQSATPHWEAFQKAWTVERH
ncbi:MAG: 3'-5' exonuclease [Nevskiales bacterium]|nr:3'-5' exonuclease [Nevskiales bacterium]